MNLLLLSLTILLVICLTIIYIGKKQILSLTLQIRERITKDSRQRISLTLWSHNFAELGKEINRELERQDEFRGQMISSNQQLKETIANLSHDLRTPLTSVKGYLQALLQSPLDSEQQETARVALQKAVTLQHLIDGFFELSVLGDGAVEPQWKMINLNNVIIDSIVQKTSFLEEQQCTPVFKPEDEDVYIKTDEELLRRILQNLLVNGIRYGCGEIEITVKTKKDAIVQIKNRVANPGSIDLEKIWDRFYVGNPARSEGAGLGLSIVKLLAEKIGASVTVDLLGDVFCVSISLPYRQSPYHIGKILDI